MKPMNDILEDPGLPFMIGRLVGSAEMASHLMRDHMATDTALMRQGELLQAVCDWFFDPEHTPTSAIRTNYGRELDVPDGPMPKGIEQHHKGVPFDQADTQVREEGV
jgi:hypothetical protein